MMRFVAGLFSASLICVSGLHADDEDFSVLFRRQYLQSFQNLLKNIDHPNAKRGAMIASPSVDKPNYFFHWVRDGGLMSDVLVRVFLGTRDPFQREPHFRRLNSYIQFSRALQIAPAPSGLGEPKFFADGKIFSDPWGRPQSDGPALRALPMIRLARALLKAGEEDYVHEHLYAPELPAETLIKADLEYIAHDWREFTFDIWEEVKGSHFYTLLLQAEALRQGAELATAMDDPGAADFYSKQMHAIEDELGSFWDSSRKIIVPTRRFQGGVNKPSGLDTSVVLAALHSRRTMNFGVADDRMLATFSRLVRAFKSLYTINQWEGAPGIAIGRYPEDSYDGVNGGSQGNPWFLTTLAMSEFLYRFESWLREEGRTVITKTNKAFFEWVSPDYRWEVDVVFDSNSWIWDAFLHDLRNQADSFVKRSFLHSDLEESKFSEQFDRETGKMRGASDLSWSYVALINAYQARRQIKD